MIEALGRDGYIVAQEMLPEAEQGDVRLFLMNGEPLIAGRPPRRLPASEHDHRPSLQHASRRRSPNR